MERIKPFWAQWEPAHELTASQNGELLVRIFLPYSDLTWINHAKQKEDQEAIKRGEIPISFTTSDEDYLAKDENGNLMPGNITEEVYWAVHHTLPIWRLSYIGQLALLTYATEDKINYYARGPNFSHTRLDHVMKTARTLEQVLKNNGFDEKTVNLGIIAAICHDLAVPPYSDPTKEIDPEALSEETRLRRLFEKYDLSPLSKYGFDPEKALEIVQNEGTIGKLLDIADKISYTAADCYAYLGDITYFTTQKKRALGPISATVNPIVDLIDQDPNWANLYKEIRIDENGQPYFENAHKLAIFLELRARMHKGLYLNPHCRAQDLLYKMLIQPLYSRNPNENYPLNPETLLFLTDSDVSQIILDHWPPLRNFSQIEFVLGVLPDYFKVQNPEAIEDKIKRLTDEGLLVIGSETIRRFNPATNFLAIDPKDKKTKPFSEIFPEKSAELEKIAEASSQTAVYYWPQTPYPNSREAKLKPFITLITEEVKRRNNGKLPHFELY